MTEQTIENEIIETVGSFSEKLIEASEVVTTKLIEVAPDVADAMLMLIQAKGIWEITTDFLITVPFLLPLFFYKTIFNKTKEWEEDLCSYDKGFYHASAFTLIALSSFISFICVCDIFNFYNWVAAFYPEGAVALKALEAAGISL